MESHVAFNIHELRDGDVVVLRVGPDEEDRGDDMTEKLVERIIEAKPDVDVTVVQLRPGDNLEFMDPDEMRRFGWSRL